MASFTQFWTARHLTGLALVVGFVIIGVGATLYAYARDKGGPIIFGQPTAVWLRLVHMHPRLWRWATVPFGAGVPVTVLAETELTLLLRAAGDPGWAPLGLVATGCSVRCRGSSLWRAPGGGSVGR
jgi:hypothetical protein